MRAEKLCMNLKMLIILLMLTSSLLSIETEFDSMSNPELEAVWNLENSYDGTISAVLDCQSFFHKLDFYHNPSGEMAENFISFSECKNLYDKISTCIDEEGVVCLDTDDIFVDSCYCK